jgi:predicted TIM-barrel fold metal-dependent hydrolase
MAITRRTLLSASGTLAAASVVPSGASAVVAKPQPLMRRIAIEEAWSIPEQLQALAAVSEGDWTNLDVENVRPLGRGQGPLAANLLDVKRRLAEMDRLGIDMHLLSLTSPGVQLFESGTAIALAQLANDRLAEVVAANPTRFGGLASFAPQDPDRAAKEMERAINTLKLNGFIVNSHTDNEYLDEPKFWPILEAAESLGRPIYLHPRCPSDGMAAPFRNYRMQAAIWGFQAETGTHAMRLILSGVFDRFPNLQIVLGHMGENIPFHLWRSDNWYRRRANAYPSKLPPSEVMKRNFHITTSGVEHGPALRYAIEVLGADRIMWAIDYPYEEMAPAVTFMNEVEIPQVQRAAIYHLNTERLFHVASADSGAARRSHQ